MSYILDALNKSAQEQRNRQTPGLDSLQGAPRAPQSRPLWLLLLAMLVVINGSFAYWFTLKPTEIRTPTTLADQGRKLPGEQVATLADVQKNPAPQYVASITPVRVADLPANVQRQIPGIRFSSHIYANDPSLRMVNINGRIVREGDSVADGISLVEISEDGVVLSYLHYTFEMSVIRDWSFD